MTTALSNNVTYDAGRVLCPSRRAERRVTRQTLGAVIAAKRAKLGLSLREAAEKSGGRFGSSTLHDLERGRRPNLNDETLIGLSEVFDVPLPRVRRLAGLAAVDLPPFEVPARANRLNMRERKVVRDMIETLLAAHRTGR